MQLCSFFNYVLKGGFVLRIGKLSSEMLNKNIIEKIKVKRPEVLVHSGIGKDCSIISFGSDCCVLSSDPITGSDSFIGRLAVNVNCNDIAASGVEPLGILVTIMAPESCSEEDIFALMNEINDAASDINVEVLGGHTEVTRAVNKMVVSITALGKGPASGYITSAGARDGDYIVVTKSAGLEGTSILASDHEKYLMSRMSRDQINNAKSYINNISVVKEGITGGRLRVSSMHDATEGGLLGALWEIAEASGRGFEIYEDNIPVTDETKKICSIFSIDPLRLLSSGMMVITTGKLDSLLRSLKDQGIDAANIGRITGYSNRRVIIKDGKEREVDPPQNDELFNIKFSDM